METITPCRKTISERFPIASFVVRVPKARHYEVACATDPRLFHTDYAAHRTPQNFYSSLGDGLAVANKGCPSGKRACQAKTQPLRCSVEGYCVP